MSTASAPWKQLLVKALETNSNLKHSSYFQLATVAPNGRPANRKVVFRGFEGDSDRIQINTDARTRKICWYFTHSWEQFRINGRVEVIDETHPDLSKHHERERSWFVSSARSKLQYVGPNPGLPSISEQPPQDVFLDASLGPVDYLNLKRNERLTFLSRTSDTEKYSITEKDPALKSLAKLEAKAMQQVRRSITLS